MNNVRVVTAWAPPNVTTDAYHAQLSDDYPSAGYLDITMQDGSQIEPSPNAYTVLSICDDPTLAAIQADIDYVVLYWERAE